MHDTNLICYRELEESYILDYRETAPKSAYSTMYEDSNLNTKIGKSIGRGVT